MKNNILVIKASKRSGMCFTSPKSIVSGYIKKKRL